VPPRKKRSRSARKQPSTTSFSCPHCGEQVDSWPDLGGGERQTYIEDCPVCCRPNRITAVLDESGRDFFLEVVAED
jgi:transcription elongation factor Elf1